MAMWRVSTNANRSTVGTYISQDPCGWMYVLWRPNNSRKGVTACTWCEWILWRILFCIFKIFLLVVDSECLFIGYSGCHMLFCIFQQSLYQNMSLCLARDGKCLSLFLWIWSTNLIQSMSRCIWYSEYPYYLVFGILNVPIIWHSTF